MAPADNPQISIMISILEPDPSNYYAGQIAAPVAKELFNDIFNYLAVAPTGSKEAAEKSMLKDVMVPELRGLSKADAIKRNRGDFKTLVERNIRNGIITPNNISIVNITLAVLNSVK